MNTVGLQNNMFLALFVPFLVFCAVRLGRYLNNYLTLLGRSTLFCRCQCRSSNWHLKLNIEIDMPYWKRYGFFVMQKYLLDTLPMHQFVLLVDNGFMYLKRIDFNNSLCYAGVAERHKKLQRRKNMQSIKVVFSITKLGKENTKQTGRGFINQDNVLLLQLKRKDGTTKWKCIDDYNNYLFPTVGKTDEYKGYYTEYREDTEIPRDDGSYDIRDTETTYFIWFKKVA